MAHTPMELLDHLTQTTFAFTLRGWKAPVEDFFSPSDENNTILHERHIWLAEDPDRYLLISPGSEASISETLQLAHKVNPNFSPLPGADPAQQLRYLGEQWEPDILLSRKDDSGRICMVAGAICFPSQWTPETKLNLPIETLHSPVPGLNEAIGEKIFKLLDRLPSGVAWLRLNWGLSASRERNQHPSRALPRLTIETPIDSIWLRMEHQALVRLPATQAILFGIRLHSYSLDTLRNKPKAAHAVAGQLRSMPEAMRNYKGIQAVADRVAAWLFQES